MSTRRLRSAGAISLMLLLLGSGSALASGSTLSWRVVHPATSPSARGYQAEAFDPKLRGIVVFGGVGSSGYLNDTWLWRAGAWHRLHPAKSPQARTNAGM